MGLSLTDDVSPSKSISLNHVISGIYDFEAWGKNPEQLVKETADLAGITKRVSPHILRHSIATTLLEHGMPLEQIQKFLGHAKIDTTQVYAASTTAMTKRVISRLCHSDSPARGVAGRWCVLEAPWILALSEFYPLHVVHKRHR